MISPARVKSFHLNPIACNVADTRSVCNINNHAYRIWNGTGEGKEFPSEPDGVQRGRYAVSM